MKATLSTPGWATSAAPVSPAPVRMLTTPGGRSACWRISARRRADSGVVSAGFSTQVLPVANAGASFQAAMRRGKFQGMTCPATPSGFGSGAKPGVSQLVGPAGVVEEMGRRQGDVDVAGLLDGFAVVEALQYGQLAGALLDDAGHPEDVLGPFLAGHGPQTSS